MGKSLQGWNYGVYGAARALRPDPTATVDCERIIGFGPASSTWTSASPASGVRAGVYVDFAGTIRKLYINLTGTTTTKVNTFTVRVNQVATSCYAANAPSQTGHILGTGEATFVAGDYIDVQWSVASGPNPSGTTLSGMWCEVETTGGHWTVYTQGSTGSGYSNDVRTRTDQGGGVAGLYMIPACIAGYAASPVKLGADHVSTTYPVTAYHPASTYAVPATEFRFVNGGTFTSSNIYCTRSGSVGYTPPTPGADNTSTTWAMSVNGTEGATLYTIYNYSPLQVTNAYLSTTVDVTISAGDRVCYWLNRYRAPVAYTSGAFSRSITGVQVSTFSTNFMSDSETELDVPIVVSSPTSYSTSTGLFTTTNAPLTGVVNWSSIISQQVSLSYLGGGSFTQAAITMPSCTAIKKLRAYCWQWTSGTCVATLYVNNIPLSQSITINGTGWFEYAGTDSKVDAGCKVAIRWEFTNWDGLISMMGYTQYATTGCPECGQDPPEPPPPCRCPDDNLHLDELATEVTRMLGEDSSGLAYWSANEIDRTINDAYSDVCHETNALELVEAVALTDNSSTATLSAYVDRIIRVTFDDQNIENVTKRELDRALPKWESLAGSISGYITSLNDVSTLTTFEAWDGSTYNSDGPFDDLEAYEYSTWTTATSYIVGDRVVVVQASGREVGYACIVLHTSGASSEPGTGATWETYWVPLALMVWATKHPPEITNDVDACPVELPAWCNLGLAFEAASRLLLRHGEQRHQPLAMAYKDIANDYWGLLKGHVANRVPEYLTSMKVRTKMRPIRPWEQVVE